MFLLCITPHAAAHGDEIPTDPGVAKDHFTAYGQSDRYELTLYYPEITAGKETHLVLFIADYKSNRPVEGAELKIGITGDPKINFEATALSPGVYEIHGIFPENKAYTVTVKISHPNGADLIGIAGVEAGKTLHAGETLHEASHAEAGQWWWFLGGLLSGALIVWFVGRRRRRVATAVLLLASAWFSAPTWNPAYAHGDDDHEHKTGNAYGKTVYTPKETQFLFEIVTQPVVTGDYQPATTMFGTIIPASGGLGVVVAPQNGRITRLNAGVGQVVRAGQALAVLEQNISMPEGVGVAGSNAALAVQIETAKVREAAAEREYARLKKIEDIAAAKDVLAAEAAWRQARSERQTLEQKAIGANAAANRRTVVLTAPISGVVGDFTLTPGAEVIAGQTLITITNLNKVYVEAQVYDRDVPVVHDGNKFIVTCSNDDHKSAEVRLISPAQTMNPGNQSQRVLFEMDNPKGEFKIGEFVTVKALNRQSSRQITVPNAAITEINGKPAIFLKESPEQFSLSYVQTGEDDGTRTLILKGLEEGGKVVVNGAYEVKMMYLNQ